ncbi:MAG: DUF2232 domain-containing protein, partial [Bdellovibrionota bacterium]
TLILGAAPMLAIRRAYGRLWFWLPLLAVAATMLAAKAVAPGVCVVVFTVLVGVYAEVEEHGSSLFNAAAVGVLASVGAAAIGLGGYLLYSKNGLQALARELATKVVERIESLNEGALLATNDLVQQVPSFMLASLFVSIWIALLWESRWRRLFRIGEASLETDERMIQFRVPDLGVWFLIAAFAGALIKHGNSTLEIVSLNVLNVMAATYFFQGLAVVAFSFRQMKLGPVMRMVWFVLLTLYLSFFVSLLGFVDFWLDFRERMARKPVQTDNRI